MRELALTEVELVNGGLGVFGTGLLFAGGAGLVFSIPTIVAGAILGIPTLGLGYIAMTAGIVGTAISGSAMVVGVVSPA